MEELTCKERRPNEVEAAQHSQRAVAEAAVGASRKQVLDALLTCAGIWWYMGRLCWACVGISMSLLVWQGERQTMSCGCLPKTPTGVEQQRGQLVVVHCSTGRGWEGWSQVAKGAGLRNDNQVYNVQWASAV